MKRTEINLRDPYVLLHDGKYYLYGTRSETCWGKADGFDCYVSRDLESFEGPYEVFHRPDGFFADRFYWAPECYYYQGAFYLVTTLGSADRKKAVYALRSESPLGPFEPWGEQLTPAGWTSIDGTLYVENGTPYLIFSHSFEDEPDRPDGDFCLLRLKEDLSGADGEPVTLFTAKQCPWARPFPFAEQEFGIQKDAYFSDGAFLMKMEDDKLFMIMSSWSVQGYAVGVAVSESGRVSGPWKLQEEPLYPENGGHGMFFRDLKGDLVFTLHYPNDKLKEHPVFLGIRREADTLKLIQEA